MMKRQFHEAPEAGLPVFRAENSPRNRRGAALVVVLGMLVLVLVLVVAFLSSVSVELQAAKKYSGGADARALADSAVSLVISQVQDATASPRLAWASQPGMIRTYDDQGAKVSAYKLYSSDRMREGGNYDPIANQPNEVPANWSAEPALYTDLNKPVAVSGTNHYPIIDPSAVAENVSGGAALSGTAAIEGCYADINNGVLAINAEQTNPLPMPVRWMYVLKSGALAVMDPGTMRVPGASMADPIVGRIAFWTDDETCKVNINTATEGTFWDRPWATGTAPSNSKAVDGGYERNLAAAIPVQNEFQRYPGHPAMTSLSVVFPPLPSESAQQYKDRIYGIIPRVSGGGSAGGTAYTSGTSAPIVPDNNRLFASVDEFMFQNAGVPRQENLKGPALSFVEEDIQKTRFFLTANSRSPEVNLFNKPRISLWPLQANTSQVGDPTGASDRNSKDKLIAFCSTVGNVPYYFQRYSTYSPANPDPSSQSPTLDYTGIPRNQELYRYLQYLTSAAVPGLGGSFLAKYPDTRDQILTEMFDYVRSLVNTFSTGETPNYFFTPFNTSNFVTGQGQVVPLELPNGTKGFGRFPTITEAALVLYNKDQLKISGTVPPNGTITSGTVTIATFPSGTYLDEYVIGDMPSGSIKISGTGFTLNTETNAPRTIGAVLILEPFNATPGQPPWTANVRYAISGLDSLGLGFDTGPLVNLVTSIDSTLNATAQTGLEANLQRPVRQPKTLGATDPNDPDPDKYPFFGSFVASGTAINFSGGTIAVDIYQGAARPLAPSDLVQTVNLQFPGVAALQLPQNGIRSVSPGTATTSGTTTITLSSPKHDTFRNYDNRLSRIVSTQNIGKGRWGIAEDGQHNLLPLIIASTAPPYAGDTVRSVEARYGGSTRGDYRMIAGLKTVPSSYFEGHGFRDSGAGTLYTGTTASQRLVHSLQIDGFQGNGDTGNSNGFYAGAGSSAINDPRGKLVAGANYNDPNRGNNARNSTMPVAPRGLNGATMSNGAAGDWDNGVGTIPDGPYINIPDQGNTNKTGAAWSLYYEKGGYINSANMMESGASFSPNRQISSAVSFGSLPTGIDPANPGAAKPWQTLLFCNNPAAGSAHPGFGTPLSGPPYTQIPDHAMLDFFTMPIVEPYAISEPFSTAGKVNMNYQIVPFTYLTRDTAVRAVLKSTNIMAIPTNAGNSYKYTNNNPPDFRYTIDPDEQKGTLVGFRRRFESGDIFRSASEICGINLVPKSLANTTSPAPGTPTYDTMDSWWGNYMLTGDNVREGPYGHIYPRLTTKSNTYTVHVQVQSISKALATGADEFVEGKDQVSGEFRGAFLIERYLDPNADTLVKPDGKTPASETDPDGMVGPYKFRVISSKKFAP